MAAITTAAAGNWSATGTWTGGVVPGNGDTVTLNHHVTVDTNTIIGTSPAENSGTYAITWGTATKKLTIASGVELRVRGDCLAQGNTTKNDVVLMQAGSSWVFDASQASTPLSQNYRFVGATAASQYTVFRIEGTSGSRCSVSSDSSGGNGFFTRGGFAPAFYLVAAYCDFLRVGDASNPLFDFYLGNTSLAELTLDNCTFDACGVITSASAPAANADISVTNCSFKNSAGTKPLVLPGFTNAGTKTVSGCVFGKSMDFGQGAWVVTDNLFLEGYVATAGTKWGTSSGNFVRKTSQPTLNVYGDLTNEFWYKDGAITNPHLLTYGVTTGLTIDGCIFSHSNANGTGDATQPGAPSGARTYTVKNCILLADDDNEVQPGKLQGCGGNANVTIINEHNTYISTNAGETGSGYGETYSGHDGIVSIKSCLAWSPNSGEASIGIRQAGSVQQSDDTKWDYNAVWNPRTGTDGTGYNSLSAGTIFSAGAPGANDVLITADPFVDRTRNLPTWDAALGGPGTAANALTELAKRNDASGYDSNYSIAALVTWVKDGFKVTDAALENAGHDAVTIGAMPYQASAVTGTATSETGGLVSAAVGTLGGAVAGDAVSTLGGLVSAAIGTPVNVGAASSTLGGLASQADGFLTPVGAVTSTMGGFASEAVGTLGGAVSGTAASVLGGLASLADGVLTAIGVVVSSLGGLQSRARQTIAPTGWHLKVRAAGPRWRIAWRPLVPNTPFPIPVSPANDTGLLLDAVRGYEMPTGLPVDYDGASLTAYWSLTPTGTTALGAISGTFPRQVTPPVFAIAFEAADMTAVLTGLTDGTAVYLVLEGSLDFRATIEHIVRTARALG